MIKYRRIAALRLSIPGMLQRAVLMAVLFIHVLLAVDTFRLKKWSND